MTRRSNTAFELLILGSSSAIPSDSRHPSAQILNIRDRLFLIDCGEGTQNRLWAHRVRWNRMSHILISHLHGDHVFGLPGLLTSLSHLQRTQPLTIAGPLGIKNFVDNIFSHSRTHLSYNLTFMELDSEVEGMVWDDGLIRVRWFPLNHRIPTVGYRFDVEETYRKLKIEKVSSFPIPVNRYRDIQVGKPVSDSGGNIYQADELSDLIHYHKSYAYCSDTRYFESVLENIKGVSVLYHETTYLEELSLKANETGHSTALQAAMIAKKAGVGKLITGHYSSRYDDLMPILKECHSVFPETILGTEGLRLEI